MDVNGISLDSTADKNISGLVNSGVNTSNQQMADSYSSGAKTAARGLLNSDDNFDQKLGGSSDPVQSAAIKSRYNQQYNRQEKEVSLKTMMNADADHVKQLQNASSLADQEVAQNREKALLKNKINQANKRARGQVVGSVLGIVGAVAAGYFTGGSGAAAGYAAGNAAGNAIGGS